MKKFYAIMASVAMVGTAYAQQLPNADFEGEWVKSVPWTSLGNTKACVYQKDTMYTPAEWVISHVIGINGVGATGVGGNTAGYNSKSAVLLRNTSNPFVKTQIVPGYVSLGASWATSTGFAANNKDGGVFGGKAFTYRPDAIEFMYDRKFSAADKAEKASFIGYIWKGTWTQDSVPGDNTLGKAVTVPMTDRDRNVLGMECAQGRTVTKTESAELIASYNYQINDTTTGWTKMTIPFEYKSEATPEKINVVFAANDYFNAAATMYDGTTLAIDNVKLVYYSKLKSLEVNGAAVEGFKPEVYAYSMKGAAPAASAVVATVNGAGAKADVAVAGKVVTVKVTNDGEDTDGLKEHTYTLTYESEAAKEGTQFNIAGKLDIESAALGGVLAKDQDATITITEYADGTCDFLLPNFSAMGLALGNIEVKNLTVVDNAGVKTYSGSVKDMPLEAGLGAADVVVNGTVNAAGVAQFKIAVTWNSMPIDVTFNGQKQGGTTGIDNVMSGAVGMYGTAGAIMVVGEGNVQVYALNGMLVKSVNVAGETEIPVAKGIYIVRLGNVTGKVIVK